MKSEGKLSPFFFFFLNQAPPLFSPQVFKTLSFHCLHTEQRFNINEFLICVYFSVFHLI